MGGTYDKPLIGTIVAFGASCDPNDPSSLPEGWLLCDGSAQSRTNYRELFGVIGTTNGKGDGETTFNLPDLRGKFLRGVDQGTGNDPDAKSRHANNLGGNSGDNVGTVQDFATALPINGHLKADNAGSHTHAVKHLPNDNSWYEIAGHHYAAWNPDSVNTDTAGIHSHLVSGGGDMESRPQNVYTEFLIYYGQKSK